MCSMRSPSKETICKLLEFQKIEGAESLFKEVIAENFPNLGEIWISQGHEAYRSTNN